MSLRRILIAVSSCIVLACLAVTSAQESSKQLKLEALLQQLQDYRTTQSATGELLTLTVSDAPARKFLTSRMPELIGKKKPTMVTEMNVWANEVQIAGRLRMVEAIPSLVEGIEWSSSPVSIGLGDSMTFGPKAAVGALIRIGPPSIPAMTKVLGQGSTMQRMEAAYVLGIIATPDARKALQDSLSKESDPEVRKYIQDGLTPPSWWPKYSAYSSDEEKRQP
jgi:hypothetical protein